MTLIQFYEHHRPSSSRSFRPCTLVMLRNLLRHSRHYSTSLSSFRAVPLLLDASLNTFRDQAFNPALPHLLPQGSFTSIPAIQKWFHEPSEHNTPCHLNTAYLKTWGPAVVPLEVTNEEGKFAQIHQPLQFFLEYVESIFSHQNALADTRVVLLS